MNTILTPQNKKKVLDVNAEVDLKISELTILLSEIKNRYLETEEAVAYSAILSLTNVLSDLEEHRLVQNKFLAGEGDAYVHGYTNALKQMVLDLNTLIEHYQPLSK